MTLPVLYDGWPLIYQPNSPAALHLLALMAGPEQIEPIVALPDLPPAWFPERASAHVRSTANNPRARLAWEQQVLPGLAAQLSPRLLHLTSSNPPLFGPPRSIVSPAGFGAGQRLSQAPEPPAGFVSRVREALSQGGMSRARGLLWPMDLPEINTSTPILRLPPDVPGVFYDGSGTEKKPGSSSNETKNHFPESCSGDLPSRYVLYHGPGSQRALRGLLNAWSWAAGSIGEEYPLLVLGQDEAVRNRLAGLVLEHELGETVRSIPEVSPEVLPDLYQNCCVLFHPAPVSPWGSSIRFAMASGKPIVANEDPWTVAMVGAAGYLVKPGDGRAAGAALISILVEDSLAQSLSSAAYQRALAWLDSSFNERLLQAYESVLSKM
jgi:glycosyltransferase involved in cell wall biosynthesis